MKRLKTNLMIATFALAVIVLAAWGMRSDGASNGAESATRAAAVAAVAQSPADDGTDGERASAPAVPIQKAERVARDNADSSTAGSGASGGADAARRQAMAAFDSVGIEVEDHAYVPGELIVRFEGESRDEAATSALESVGAEIKEELPLPGTVLVEVPDETTVTAAVDALEARDGVRYAEPNYIRKLTATSNDPKLSDQWGLVNDGVRWSGVADADIDATDAWDLTTGSSAVTVAVIDTGVDWRHEDLSANIWTNPGESGNGKETNGVDDDGNGFKDDVRGWDFPAKDNNPEPKAGSSGSEHGTHVAGIIAARGNNGVGVSGVSWASKIMPISIQPEFAILGGLDSASVISAYGYASKNGARIANGSFGGGPYSKAEYDALKAATGTLFVFAAGNSNKDNDATPMYPCSYDLSNVLCVGNSTPNDGIQKFTVGGSTVGSHYGLKSVDLAAPGTDIVSTVPGNGYHPYTGTSMASPMVAGAAALVLSRNSALTPSQVKSALMTGVDIVPEWVGKTVTGGRLNINRSINTASIQRGTGTVSISGGNQVRYVASAGGASRAGVYLSGTTYTVFDHSSTLSATAPCTKVNSWQVNCPSAGITSIRADLGDLDDTFVNATSRPSTINGADGADTLYGGTGADTLNGGNGDDRLNGRTGKDTHNGGAGSDTVSYSDRLDVNLSISLNGVANDGASGENDVIATDVENAVGGEGADRITGSSAANRLSGGGGDDTIDPGNGDDIVTGGGGADQIDYRSATAGVIVDLSVTGPQWTVSSGNDTLTSIDGVIGSRFNDIISGNAADNVLGGHSGDDTINGNGGSDTASYRTDTAGVTVTLDTIVPQLTGGSGLDWLLGISNLEGSTYNDTLTGTAANNRIAGGLGRNTLIAAGGTDTLYFPQAAGAVTVNLGSAAAQPVSTGANDTISGFENVEGTRFNDALTGSSGANNIDAGYGNDVVNGSGGSDTIDFTSIRAPFGVTVDLTNAAQQDTKIAGLDTITNTENVTGTTQGDSFVASTAGNRIDGREGGDFISYSKMTTGVKASLASTSPQATGGSGTDTLLNLEWLIGTSFADTITGSAGDNWLLTGNGADTVNGGDGRDLSANRDGASDTVNCGAGTDAASADSLPLDPTASSCETLVRS